MSRALLGFVIFGALSNLGSAADFLRHGWRGLAEFEALFAALGAGLAWRIHGAPERILAHARLTASLFILHVAGFLSLTGAAHAGEVLLHFTIFPTLFVFYLGIGRGTVWSLAGLCLVTLPVLAHSLVPGLPVLQAYEFRSELLLGSVFFIFLVQLGFNVLFQRSRTDRIAQLEEALARQRKLRDERDELQVQILHASKLAWIGELGAGVAHEIRNPLAAAQMQWGLIKRILDLRKRNGTADPKTDADEERLRNALDIAFSQIASITTGLTQFARVDRESAGPFDPHHAVRECVHLVETLYSTQGIRIHTELNASRSIVLGNSGRFNQVVVNLLSNSRDALKSSGTHDPRIRIRSESGPERLLLCVSDNGPGIAPEHLDRIFQPFFSTKPSGLGTGLGLSLCYSIVQEMGGQISVRSDYGKGAEFRIELPLLR